MIIDVKVPQLSESVAEATLVSWHKQVGEALSRDENLIDIETDKVVLELPAPADGVLVELLKPNGATVTAGEVLAGVVSLLNPSVIAVGGILAQAHEQLIAGIRAAAIPVIVAAPGPALACDTTRTGPPKPAATSAV